MGVQRFFLPKEAKPDNQERIPMSFEEQRRSMIREGEGSIPHMYLDTRGLVTVAVGQLQDDLTRDREKR